MKIYYNDAPCGSGKTTAILKHIINNPGLYLYAVNKIDIMRERRNDLAGTNIKTFPINSEEPGKIAEQLDNALQRIVGQRIKHAVIFITHQALITNDFGAFTNLSAQLVIDEHFNVFELVKLDLFKNSGYRTILPYFRVRRVTNDIGILSLSTKGKIILHQMHKTGASLAQAGYAKLMRVIDRNQVFVDRQKLRKLLNGQIASLEDKARFDMHYFVAPDFLHPFKRVTVLADNFKNSTMYRFWRRQYDIQWVELPLDVRTRKIPLQQRVTINYFIERPASFKLLDDKNSLAVQQVASYFAANMPTNYVWTANERYKATLEAALDITDYETPRAAGTNKHITKTTAICLLSIKPEPNLICAASNWISGIRMADYVECLEYDAIHQMVMRSNLRDYNASDHVAIFVWDKQQAAALNRMMGGHCSVKHIAGVVVVQAAGKCGRPKKGQVMTSAERTRKCRQGKKDMARKFTATIQSS